MKIQNKILIYDIETDSVDPQTANMKWFGCYSYVDDKLYMFDHTETEKIRDIINRHDVFVGFNNESYDQVIMERHGFKFEHTNLDLYNICAEGQIDEFRSRGRRLKELGFKPVNYKLRTIAELLGFKILKGDINYDIFKKNQWNPEEIKEIKKYLKADILVTKQLYEFLEDNYKLLNSFLREKRQHQFIHLTKSIGSLAYHIVCDQAGIPVLWSDNKADPNNKILGGHRIIPRWEKVSGDIITLDFASAYPHMLVQGNLFSPKNDGGFKTNDYFELKGCYDDKEQGKIETVILDLLKKRLKAKKDGDVKLNKSLKIIINSIYGICGNPAYKNFYNPTTASDCTKLTRIVLRKVCARLDVMGCIIIGGFTDSITILKPKYINNDEILAVVNTELSQAKKHLPFPADSFKMELESEYKFLWYLFKKGVATQNNYFYVTKDNKLGNKGGSIFDKNTPKVIMDIFDEYISPRIIKQLNVNFSMKELINELNKRLQKDISLCCKSITVKKYDQYKSKTSQHYLISQKYGEGKHQLLDNTAGIGVGGSKIKKCTVEEFTSNNLTINDLDLSKLTKYFKEFTETGKEILKVENEARR